MIGLLNKVMDSWLSLFSNIRVPLLLANIDNKKVEDKIGSKLKAGVVVSVKDLENVSPSYLLILALIYSILLLLYRTFISAY